MNYEAVAEWVNLRGGPMDGSVIPHGLCSSGGFVGFIGYRVWVIDQDFRPLVWRWEEKPEDACFEVTYDWSSNGEYLVWKATHAVRGFP